MFNVWWYEQISFSNFWAVKHTAYKQYNCTEIKKTSQINVKAPTEISYLNCLSTWADT